MLHCVHRVRTLCSAGKRRFLDIGLQHTTQGEASRVRHRAPTSSCVAYHLCDCCHPTPILHIGIPTRKCGYTYRSATHGHYNSDSHCVHHIRRQVGQEEIGVTLPIYSNRRLPSQIKKTVFKHRNLKTAAVGVRRLELPTSTSRTWRAANCATPRLAFSVQIYKLFFIYPRVLGFFWFCLELLLHFGIEDCF